MMGMIMKKILLFILIISTICLGQHTGWNSRTGWNGWGAPETNQFLDEYVRGYWLSSDLTDDISTYSNNMSTAANGVLYTAATSSLNPDVEDFTIDCWFLTASADSQKFIWSNHDSPNGANYFLYIAPDTAGATNSGRALGKITDDDAENISYNATEFDVADSTWRCVTVRYTNNGGDGYVTTWIDGLKWAEEDGASNLIDSINVNQEFALKGISESAPVNGYGTFTAATDQIGEVRFSMTKRTDAEVTTYYETRAASYGITPDVNIIRPHTFAATFDNVDSLDARWKNASPDYYVDTTQSFIGGRCVSFNTDSTGTSDETYWYIQDDNVPDTSYTSFYIKLSNDFEMTDAADAFTFITMTGLNGVGFYFGFDESSGNVRPYLRRIYGGSSYSYGSNITVSDWHRIEIKYPTSNTIEWWVDGVSQGTIAAADNKLRRFSLNAIGVDATTNGIVSIDHIQWTPAEQTTQPTWNISAIDNIVGYWDGSTGVYHSATLVRRWDDQGPTESQYITQATDTNKPTRPDSNYISFDGVDNYMQRSDNDDISFGDASNDTTFSFAWHGIIDDATNCNIVCKWTSSGYEYRLMTNATDELWWTLYDNATNQRIGILSDTTLTASEGDTITIVASYSGNEANTGLKLYLNGVALTTTTSDAGSYTAMHNGTAPLVIGAQLQYPNYGDLKFGDFVLVKDILTPDEANKLNIFWNP